MPPPRRNAWNELSAFVSYRADRFLEREPTLQVAALFGLAVSVVIAWALLLAHFDPDAPNGGEAVWWALTRFLDGGTMAGDPASRRLLATAATLSGVFGVAILTSVLTSKMGERISVLASGESPVVERGHILVLGYDPRVRVIAEELGRSGKKLVLVVVATQARKAVEAAIGSPPGVRVVVRTGDAQLDSVLLNVRAHRARTIIVLPPGGRSDEEAVRWTFVTLLAVRRVVEAEGESTRPRLVVEARSEGAEVRLGRALAPSWQEGPGAGGAGPLVLATEFISPASAIGGLLAMALRQPGLYPVLHSLLSFDGVDFEFEPVGSGQLGWTWEAAEAAMRGAIPLGLARRAGEGSRLVVELNPPRDGSRRLGPGDAYALLRRTGARLSFVSAGEPPATRYPNAVPLANRRSVLILGANASLPSLLDHLPAVLHPGDRVRLVTGREPGAQRASEGIDAAVRALADAGVTLTVDAGNPLEVAASLRPDEEGRVVVILASDESRDRSCDALAVEMLVALRHNAGPGRAVTDVHSAATASYLAGEGNDFLVSSQIVAMMFTQEALSPEVAEALRQLLKARAEQHIETLPVEPLGFSAGASFATLAATLRAGGQIALGYQLTRAPGQPVRLVPWAEDAGWAVPGAVVIALAPSPSARGGPGAQLPR